MGSKKKKKDTTYQAAVSGAKGTIRILLYVLLICILIFIGKTAYSFGYLIFYQEPEADTQADGQEVTVIVHEGDSVYDVGMTLQEKGLIERPVIFWAQEKLSDYRGKIQPGTYLLNTHETVDQMLAILSGKNTEGQPAQEENQEENSEEETSDEAGTESGEESAS